MNVRRARSDELNAYREIRRRVLHFTAPLFRQWLRPNAHRLAAWPTFPDGDVYYHSWRPEFADHPLASWSADEPPDLDAIALRAMVDFPAVQNPLELRQWLDVVATLRPRTVVEIGSGAGGHFYALAQLAHAEALLVSIDMPDGGYGGGHGDLIARILRSFAAPGQRIETIGDRSFHYSTRRDLERILDGRPIDLLFIDGDHSYGGVRSDLAMYQPLCAPDAMIALHDICVTPENSGRGFDVGIFWKELAATRPTQTIIAAGAIPGVHAQDGMPRDQLQPMAFGIGLLPPPS